jgi:hypothetical protein
MVNGENSEMLIEEYKYNVPVMVDEIIPES